MTAEQRQFAEDRLQRGERVEDIATKLNVSPETIGRVRRKAFGPQRAVGKRKAEPPSSPQLEEIEADSLPDTLTDADIEQFERIAKRLANNTENPAFTARGVDLWLKIQEHKRRNAPPPKADPNEDPDMIRLAKLARERLHLYIDKIKL